MTSLVLLPILFRGRFIPDKTLNELLNLVDSKAVASEYFLFHFFGLLELCRKSNLEPESVGILQLQSQILIQPKLNMRQVTHINDVGDALGILSWGLLQKGSIVAQSQDVKHRVHVGGRSEVQSRSDMSPVISLHRIFVLPVVFVRSIFFPKHEIYEYFVEQRKADFSAYLDSLIISDTVFIEDNEVG